jgi:hypothetical protein
VFDESPASGRLRQGEILKGFLEAPSREVFAKKPEDGAQFSAEIVEHPWLMVMTPDCDLEWDFEERNNPGEKVNPGKLLDHIICCPMHDAEHVKVRGGLTSKLWKVVRTNENRRYYYIEDSACELLAGAVTVDFKRIVGVPASLLHDTENSRNLVRVAVVSRIYREDIMQRFASFLSRVALPD